MKAMKELLSKGEIADDEDPLTLNDTKQQYEENMIKTKFLSLIGKKRPTRTYQAYPDCTVANNCSLYNWVAIDGRRFFIAKDTVISRSLILREKKWFFNSLVPFIQDKSIFFCDIDYLGQNETIEEVIQYINKVLSDVYDQHLLEEIWITKSESKTGRYHVYLPQIIVTKKKLPILWNEINTLCREKGMKGRYDTKSGRWKMPVDEECTQGIRLDGFDKFNKETRRYDTNTKYLPYLRSEDGQNFEEFHLDKTFYERTYLLVDDDETSSGQKRSLHSNESPFASQISTTSNSNNNSSFEFDSQIPTLDHSLLQDTTETTDSESIHHVTFRNHDAVKYLTSHHQCVMDELAEHKISKIDIQNIGQNDELIRISCGKTPKDRYCPFVKKTHKSNNVWFMWVNKTKELHLNCNKCKRKKPHKIKLPRQRTPDLSQIFSQFSQVDDMENTEDDEIQNSEIEERSAGLWTDIDIAALYLEFHRNLIYTTNFKFKHAKKSDGTFFHYDKSSGIWMGDKGSYILKKDLATKFKIYMQRIFNQKIRNEHDEEKLKSLRNQRSLINRKLGDMKNIKGILDGLKTLCIQDEIDLDQNEWYFVANNKVMDLRTNQLVIPKKDDYVTNITKAHFDIVPFDEEKNKYIDDMIFKKLFPDPSERRTVLIYLSTILNGKTLKKFCVNLGLFTSYIFIPNF